MIRGTRAGSILVAVAVAATPASADRPLGLASLEGRLVFVHQDRALAISDGNRAPGGTFAAPYLQGEFSLIDGVRGGSGRFRIGDYLLTGLGLGLGTASGLDRMWYSAMFGFGLQVALNIVPQVDVGARLYLGAKISPLSMAGVYREGWLRVGPIHGAVTTAFWDKRVESEIDGEVFKGATYDMFKVSGRWVIQESKRAAYFGLVVEREHVVSFVDDQLTQWEVSLIVGLFDPQRRR